MMTAVATGEVSRAELEAFFVETTAARVAPCRKLFDGNAMETKMEPEDLLALGIKMQSLHQPGDKLGALAIVLPPHLLDPVRRLIGILAVIDRPLRVFTDIAEARVWIERGNRNGSGRQRRRN